MARPTHSRRARRPIQLPLRPRTWGGARKGAGRKPGPVRLVAHRARPALASRHPVHVTLKLDPSLPDLRDEDLSRQVQACLARGKEREGFRLVHYSIQTHHLHLIVEAAGADALTRGVRGLCVRLARKINRACGRTGRVFVERYFARALKTPREVRRCLCYVLNNVRRHAARHGRELLPGWIDDCSSGRFFDGWRGGRPVLPRDEEPTVAAPRDEVPTVAAPRDEEPTVAAPRTWLLSTGWRRWSLLRIEEVPGPEP